jgi:hypothetical protein
LEYLNDFCEKNFLKPHFVNLIEYDNKTDRVFENFINNSLVKKTVPKRRSQKTENRMQHSNSVDVRDSVMMTSAKKNDCLVF